MPMAMPQSPRLAWRIPVIVKGADPQGPLRLEKTTVGSLSAHGACLRTDLDFQVGDVLTLATPLGVCLAASVQWVGRSGTSQAGYIGIQCLGMAEQLGVSLAERLSSL